MATPKQKLAAKKVLEGMPISKAMGEVGYASSTANATGKLTNSKGWQELMDKYIPDSDLAKVHKEGLEATTFYSEGIGNGFTELIEKPDYSVRHKYLKTGYELKGKMKPDLLPPGTTTNQTLIIINPPPNGTPKD